MEENDSNSVEVMERVREPELMEDALQVKAYAEADFSGSDDAFLFRTEELIFRLGKKPSSQTVIVDLGCGPGNITERLARKWPMAKVFGIDGSGFMLAKAIERKKEAEFANELKMLSYCFCNISKLADELVNLKGKVDLVVSNSLLHHLHEPIDLWRTVIYLSAPGAVHLHRDLRRPLSSQKAIALQKRYLPDAPSILIRDYLASLHASFSVNEVKAQLLEVGLDSWEVFELDDRYLEVTGTA